MPKDSTKSLFSPDAVPTIADAPYDLHICAAAVPTPPAA